MAGNSDIILGSRNKIMSYKMSNNSVTYFYYGRHFFLLSACACNGY